MGGDAHNKMLPIYFIKVIEGHGNHSAVGKGREAEVGFPLGGGAGLPGKSLPESLERSL